MGTKQHPQLKKVSVKSNGNSGLVVCLSKKEKPTKVQGKGSSQSECQLVKWHDISIEATSTFGELKMILSLVTSLEPREQRLLFRGKERDDNEFLHMIGVRDKDKVLLLEDPAIKEKKLLGLASGQPINNPCCV
ncbi:Ubiquitin-like domain superfamily [Sesbania bispinosa]|nr:Ubiquitin-like domain superfamily [Sesbania bispinosa]